MALRQPTIRLWQSLSLRPSINVGLMTYQETVSRLRHLKSPEETFYNT
jgi:hypothetical protein